MPNWCSNTVLIQGDHDSIQEVIDALEQDGRKFDFNAIIKMPDALVGGTAPERDIEKAEENIKLYGASDWYNWANENWGTKWNVDADRHDVDHTVMLNGLRTVTYTFETAWAPPTPVYEVLAARFPNTNIYACWDEPGVGFSGYVMYRDGKLLRRHDEDESFYSKNLHYNPTKEIFEYFPDEKQVLSDEEAAKEVKEYLNNAIRLLQQQIQQPNN